MDQLAAPPEKPSLDYGSCFDPLRCPLCGFGPFLGWLYRDIHVSNCDGIHD